MLSLLLCVQHVSALGLSLIGIDEEGSRFINDGDLITKDLGMQVKVEGNASEIIVFLVSKNDHFELATIDKSIKEILLPSEDQAVDLKGVEGPVRILAYKNNSDALSKFRGCKENCSNEVYKAALVNLLIDVIDKRSKYIDLDSAPKVAASEKISFPKFGLSKKSIEVSEKIDTKIEAATRGPNEIRVYREVSPSVVLILNIEKDVFGTGSVIKKTEGKTTILTNYHVIEGADKVEVKVKRTNRGSFKKAQTYVAKVVKSNPRGDLALIQVNDEISAPVIKIDHQLVDLEIGQDVHAIGHPKGEFWTYTKGYVSQLRDDYQWLNYQADLVIQTQTPINTGNSGGPLLNDLGVMVGVNSFISDGEGLNYAISSSDVWKFLSSDGYSHNASKKSEDSEDVRIINELEKDTNNDGVKELILGVDLNNDDIPDGVIIVDKKNNKRTFLVDLNNNKKFERKLIDKDNNGLFDVFLQDEDEDGEWDYVGYDKDGDGEPDKYEKL